MCRVNDVCVCVHTGTPLKMNEDRFERDNRDSIEHDLFIIYILWAVYVMGERGLLLPAKKSKIFDWLSLLPAPPTLTDRP